MYFYADFLYESEAYCESANMAFLFCLAVMKRTLPSHYQAADFFILLKRKKRKKKPKPEILDWIWLNCHCVFLRMCLHVNDAEN